MDELLVAAKNLLDKINEVHASHAYAAIFLIAHRSGVIYDGPVYGAEVAKLQEAIQALTPAVEGD